MDLSLIVVLVELDAMELDDVMEPDAMGPGAMAKLDGNLNVVE